MAEESRRPSEMYVCKRCGITASTRAGRKSTGMCRDCLGDPVVRAQLRREKEGKA